LHGQAEPCEIREKVESIKRHDFHSCCCFYCQFSPLGDFIEGERRSKGSFTFIIFITILLRIFIKIVFKDEAMIGLLAV